MYPSGSPNKTWKKKTWYMFFIVLLLCYKTMVDNHLNKVQQKIYKSEYNEAYIWYNFRFRNNLRYVGRTPLLSFQLMRIEVGNLSILIGSLFETVDLWFIIHCLSPSNLKKGTYILYLFRSLNCSYITLATRHLAGEGLLWLLYKKVHVTLEIKSMNPNSLDSLNISSICARFLTLIIVLMIPCWRLSIGVRVFYPPPIH